MQKGRSADNLKLCGDSGYVAKQEFRLRTSKEFERLKLRMPRIYKGIIKKNAMLSYMNIKSGSVRILMANLNCQLDRN